MTVAPFTTYRQACDDYQRIEAAIAYLERNYAAQPGLGEVAAHVGLSEYHFQRLFTRWAGVSPKRFLQFLTKEHARQLLESADNLLDVAYQSGLSGPGRLHDLFVSCEAVTPGEYKQRGAGLLIRYGWHPTPFGECLMAVTGRGVCSLSFPAQHEREQVLGALRARWERAEIVADQAATGALVERIFPLAQAPQGGAVQLYLHGTNFQIKVWEALLRIPPGRVVSYEAIARSLGMPSAARAVSSAVAHNPVAVLVPCHRVIRKIGVFSGYRWGTARKKALLGWEMSRALPVNQPESVESL